MINRSEVEIPVEGSHLQGLLAIPEQARGIVIFAHGSGSSRFSVRNQSVARHLNELGLATLLFDLLTNDENLMDERDGRYRFNISLLAHRLLAAIHWIRNNPKTHVLPIGLFGASTGAAAAIAAAVELPELINSIVSRGGRPDLAGMGALHELRSPTLFIIGSDDRDVIELNRIASHELRCNTKTIIISGATHLFEETGALDQVIDHTASWFLEHFMISKTSQRQTKGEDPA